MEMGAFLALRYRSLGVLKTLALLAFETSGDEAVCWRRSRSVRRPNSTKSSKNPPRRCTCSSRQTATKPRSLPIPGKMNEEQEVAQNLRGCFAHIRGARQRAIRPVFAGGCRPRRFAEGHGDLLNTPLIATTTVTAAAAWHQSFGKVPRRLFSGANRAGHAEADGVASDAPADRHGRLRQHVGLHRMAGKQSAVIAVSQ